MSATRLPGPATAAQVAPALAPAVPGQRSPAPVPGAWLRTLGATQSHVSQQLTAAALTGGRDTSAHGEPAAASPAEGGPELSAAALVEALDGSERKLLLDHIARAYPDVVEAGLALVAEWRAECAERRHRAALDRKYAKRRVKRAEEGNRG